MSAVKIGGEQVTVPELNGVKAIETLRLVQKIMQLAPGLIRKRAEFIKEYGAENVEELDRGQAKLRFRPIPVADEVPVLHDGEPVLDPKTGAPLYEQVAKLGANDEPITVPSPVDRMTDADWESMGNVLKVPQRPSDVEIGLEVLGDVLDTALEPAQQLLALALAPNSEVLQHKRDGDLPDYLKKRGEALIERAMIDELMELAVVVIETANGQVRGRLTQLGDRWGNALSALGLGRMLSAPTTATETETGSPTSRTPSSDDSPTPTDGMSGKSSAPVGAPS